MTQKVYYDRLTKEDYNYRPIGRRISEREGGEDGESRKGDCGKSIKGRGRTGEGSGRTKGREESGEKGGRKKTV